METEADSRLAWRTTATGLLISEPYEWQVVVPEPSTFALIVTGQAWLMDWATMEQVLLPEGSVDIEPDFIVDTSGIPLAPPGLLWQESRSDQGLTLRIVPEPGTLVLLITGGLGLLLSAWRKRRWW